MKEEIVEHIFSPLKEEDWILIKTNQGVYSLRFGGYKKENEIIQIFDYEELTFPYKGYKIKEVYSDDYWVFILLENEKIISFGEIDISFSGETKLGVQFESISDFDDGFFESGDLFTLTTGENGWSKRILND